MKIEIRRINQTVTQVHTELDRLCVEELGSGSYGRALLTPRGTVIKVLYGADRAYTHWIRTALKYQSNPWMPRIFRARRLLCIPSYYAARDARLEGNTWSTRKQHAELLVVEMERLHESYGSAAPNPADLMYYNAGHYKFGAVRALYGCAQPVNVADIEIDEVMQLVTCNGRFSYDVRCANVLKRDDGQLVITDPICGGN